MTNDSSTTPERLAELEIRCAELERLVDQLNEVLVEHTTLLARVQRENAELRDLVRAPEKADPLDEPPPPHY